MANKVAIAFDQLDCGGFHHVSVMFVKIKYGRRDSLHHY